MAIGTPVLATPVVGLGTATTNISTASFTPEANSRLFVFVNGFQDVTPPATPVITDSVGLTWSLVVDAPHDAGSNKRIRASLFTATVGGSPAAMTITSTWSTSQAQSSITVITITGTGTDLSNASFGVSTVGDPTVTLSAMSAGSCGITFSSAEGGSNMTQPTGYVRLLNTVASTARIVSFAYDLSSPGTSQNWTSLNAKAQAVGVEVKEPGGATDNLTANSVSSATAVETATVGTIHVIAATSIQSVTDTGDGSLGQTHGINANSIATAPSSGTASMAQIHDLEATDIGTAPNVEEPSIGQRSDLTATSITTAPSVSVPAFAQIQSFLAISVGTVPSVSTASMGQVHDLFASSITTAPTVSHPALTENPTVGGYGYDEYLMLGIRI